MKERFKTVEGMFTSAFSQMGEKDDNGNEIKATEKPLTKEEYEQKVLQKINDALSNTKQ